MRARSLVTLRGLGLTWFDDGSSGLLHEGRRSEIVMFVRRVGARERFGGETAVGGVSAEIARPGVVRLLEKEPTKAERYGHAAALLAIVERRGAPPRAASRDALSQTTRP